MKRTFAAVALLLLTGSLPARSETVGEDFAPCADAAADARLSGSLCAHFTPKGEKSALFLRQFPSEAPSRGQVWVVAGESAAALYPKVATLRKAFPAYDLILPDRRAQTRVAARDLQAEIDHYSHGGATLLYGASQGGEVVLKALPLVRPHRVEAVILDHPAAQPSSAPLSASTPNDLVPEAGMDMPAPRTLVLQSTSEFTPLPDLDRKSPLTVYKIDGAPDSVTLDVPECAAPLIRDFVENASDGGAPCAAKLTIHF